MPGPSSLTIFCVVIDLMDLLLFEIIYCAAIEKKIFKIQNLDFYVGKSNSLFHTFMMLNTEKH